jgi:single-strand DNA-binding protein
MLNRITVQGRLTKDPELRRTGNGTPVCSFTIACERDFRDNDGNKATDFIDIVAWRGVAEFVSRYFTKGRMVAIDGRMQIRPWQDKDGNKRQNVEVLADHAYFCDSQRDGATPHPSPAVTPSPQGEGFEEVEDDGELPF